MTDDLIMELLFWTMVAGVALIVVGLLVNAYLDLKKWLDD